MVKVAIGAGQSHNATILNYGLDPCDFLGERER